mmetsp:Transcript_3793/g.11254  ORF Transcript_3793/g.11254 Transcript_3793/m.11254 type:complete len:255 (+) Transcript_3793:627-1391(+)
MSQLGCVVALARTQSASFWHLSINSSAVRSRKAPPEAVRMTLRMPPGGTPWSAWKMAECSESAGVIATPCFSRSGRIAGPPAIRVSLLASAMSLPASMAATVGARPAVPTTPVTTTPASAHVEQAVAASGPATSSTEAASTPAALSASFSGSSLLASEMPTTRTVWRNSATCAASSAKLAPAQSATTEKRSGRARAKSKVCVPMEPVEPSTEMLLCQSPLPASDASTVFLRDVASSTGAAFGYATVSFSESTRT